ncbi:MAG: hypothetical protein ACR2HR_00310 [Euzebya sp.]|jgi:hypothetical protein
MTTIIAPPAAWALLEAALRTRRPIHVSYHNRQRLICPHALGHNHNRPIVLGYQTGGHTSTGTLAADPTKRWRWLFVDEIDQAVPADPTSHWQTADNYNPTHPFPHAVDEVTIAITSPTTAT